jgi:hypothetical protein
MKASDIAEIVFDVAAVGLFLSALLALWLLTIWPLQLMATCLVILGVAGLVANRAETTFRPATPGWRPAPKRDTVSEGEDETDLADDRWAGVSSKDLA